MHCCTVLIACLNGAGAKKKQLMVDKPDDDGLGGGSYDPIDDYDFM